MLVRGRKKVVAPFELKGPDTKDLDRIMPGRGKTPVQQAWEYANDAPGAKWVLVSNCVELRLYRYGRGREAYEVFDLTRLNEARRTPPFVGNSQRAQSPRARRRRGFCARQTPPTPTSPTGCTRITGVCARG